MLEGIHIQNFRCFEDFQLEGFGRVNLIGGMNNSGKTVLLEGILLGDKNPFNNVAYLKHVRYNNNESWLGDASNDWNDLFFNKQVDRIIKSTYFWSTKGSTSLKVSFHLEEISNLGKLVLKAFINEQFYALAKLEAQQGTKHPKVEIIDSTASINSTAPMIRMMSTGINLTPETLAEAYSQLELIGQEHHILQAIKTIDPSIEALKVIVIGRPSLYAKRANESLLPLEFFGDAVTKLTCLALGLLDSQNGILLIDEIENGIHYTNQKQVWEFIFQLAEQFNVQVFATTHSKEMADAFNKVALEQEEQTKARYIEMSRHYKTNKIIGTILEPSILRHKIDHNQAFRGE